MLNVGLDLSGKPQYGVSGGTAPTYGLYFIEYTSNIISWEFFLS